MDPIIQIQGRELEMLLDELRDENHVIWSLRFAIDGDCVKVKINSGCWSPPLGKVEA